jgi:hypothetical protein
MEIVMTQHRNRYAFTNLGPVTIIDGGDYTTKKIRDALVKQGFEDIRWVRNWASFLGWLNVIEIDAKAIS